MYTYTYICIYIYIHMYIHVNIRCINVYTYVHMYIHMYVFMYMCPWPGSLVHYILCRVPRHIESDGQVRVLRLGVAR